MLAEKIADIDARLDEVMTERQNLDKRLTFLLQDGDLEMASSFRGEYKRQFSALNDEERELGRRRRHLQLMQNQLKEAQDTRRNEWLEAGQQGSWLHPQEGLGFVEGLLIGKYLRRSSFAAWMRQKSDYSLCSRTYPHPILRMRFHSACRQVERPRPGSNGKPSA